ncbi:MAG: hypothetical protein JTT12_05470 [Candidatus Brockarchaeota archaeon]|nr:hypothetical protein [Candidatus Brockarchaeota archaeon]
MSEKKVEERVTRLETIVENLEGRVETLEKNITEMDKKLDTLLSEMNNLNNKIAYTWIKFMLQNIGLPIVIAVISLAIAKHL